MITVQFRQMINAARKSGVNLGPSFLGNRRYFVKNPMKLLLADGRPTIHLNITVEDRVRYRTKPVHVLNTGKTVNNNGMFTGKTIFNANHPISVRHYSSLPTPEKFVINPAYNDSYIKIIAESAPVQAMQDLLLRAHEFTGLPWWATIISVTLVLKTLTLPIFVFQQYNTAKALTVSEGMKDFVEERKKDANYDVYALRKDPKIVQKKFNSAVRREWKRRVIEANCHPLKGLALALLQLPIWVSMSFAIRNLCFMLPYPTEIAQHVFLELTTGGIGWFSNLVQRDTFYILPLLLGAQHCASVEIQRMATKMPVTRSATIMKYVHRTMAVFSVVITSFMPAGMALYWTVSSSFHLFQQILLLSPKVRKLARIPETKYDSADPYGPLRNALRKGFTVKSAAAEPVVKLKRSGHPLPR